MAHTSTKTARINALLRSTAIALLAGAAMLMSACESATQIDTPFKTNPAKITPIETEINVEITELVYYNKTDAWLWSHNASHKAFSIDTSDGAPICSAELELIELPSSGGNDELIALRNVRLHLDDMKAGVIKTCRSSLQSGENDSFVDLEYLLEMNGQQEMRNHQAEFMLEMQERELPAGLDGRRQVEITFETTIDGPAEALKYQVKGSITLQF